MNKLYSNLTQQYSFKHNNDVFDLMFIQLPLQIMFLDFVKYTEDRNLPRPVITRVIDEQIPGISVSRTHEQGRAIDISSKGWYADQIDDALKYFKKKYSHWGAIPFPSEDNPKPKSNPLVYHMGTGYHFHMQIRPGLKDFLITPK